MGKRHAPQNQPSTHRQSVGEMLEGQTPACERAACTRNNSHTSGPSPAVTKTPLPSRGRSEIEAKSLWIVSFCSRWACWAQIQSARHSSKPPHTESYLGRGNFFRAYIRNTSLGQGEAWTRWHWEKKTFTDSNIDMFPWHSGSTILFIASWKASSHLILVFIKWQIKGGFSG